MPVGILGEMKKKKHNLNGFLDRAVTVMEEHMGGLSVEDAKSLLADLRKLAAKYSRSATRKKSAKSHRRMASRNSSRTSSKRQ
jgi:hypothetical protein